MKAAKMDPRELDNLGQPDLQIAGLQIWIHGRQFPDANDYWDGNWVRATAYCIYPGSVVRTHGSIIHLGEIAGLLHGCEDLYNTLKGSAGLDCTEPNLNVQLAATTMGHIKIIISITPDHLAETHEYTDEIDQTYLPPVITACKQIIEKY